MSILAWIEDQKRLKLLNAPKYVNPASDSSKGLWTRCDKCGVILYIKHLKENQRVCFGCSYHLQMSSQERVENLLDKESWRPLDETVSPCDPLAFHDQKDYTDRLKEAQERTGLQDAIQTGSGMVDGIPVALGVMDFDFMGGSMGSVVGEKVTRLIEYATQEGLILILVCASGGARMQEGVFSLMQMAKISSALQVYQSCANLLYISILTSPTTGGVTASFAMLGDIILAEPKALIAFAGRRVIEQTLCEDLPDDFQTSEYMLHHGLLDLIVPRRFLRQALSETIRLYKDAPFKKPGRIPYGVQNPITFLTEEKIRRHVRSNAAHNPQMQNTKHRLCSAAAQAEALRVSSLEDFSQTKSTTLEARQSLKQKSLLELSQEELLTLSPHAPGKPGAAGEGSLELSSVSEEGTKSSRPEGEGLLNLSPRRGEGSLELSSASEEALREVSPAAPGKPGAWGETLLNQNQLNTRPLQQNLLSRNTGDYRNILTSFQTMFYLFSKERVLPFVSDTNLITGSVQKANQFDTGVDINSTWFSQDAQESNTFLYNFFALSEETNKNETSSLIQQRNGTLSNGTLPKSDQKHLDFFNQSLELAATKSVEWRAFYVHQRISKITGFLEDFVKIESHFTERANTTSHKFNNEYDHEKPEITELKASQPQTEVMYQQEKTLTNLNVQNMLFYKSILSVQGKSGL